MALKGPADSGPNPFAGVSLLTSAPPKSDSNPFAGVSLFSSPAGAAAAPAKSDANPFAGVSLFSALGGSASLFANATNNFVAGSSFGSTPGQQSVAAATGASAAAPAPAAAATAATAVAPVAPAEGDKEQRKTDNPFSGLSLFSSTTPTNTQSGGSSGGIFAAAASALSSSASSTGQGFASSNADATADLKRPADSMAEDWSKPSQDSAKRQKAADAAVGDEADDGTPPASPEPEPDSIDAGPTGEEDEEVLFSSECKLWKLVKEGSVAKSIDGATESGSASASASGDKQATSSAVPTQENGWRWQERGTGILHVNRHRQTGGARMVMRMRGVLKLLLNTPVLPTAKYEKVGQKTVRFVGLEAEEVTDSKVALSAFRVTLQNGEQQGRLLDMLKSLL